MNETITAEQFTESAATMEQELETKLDAIRKVRVAFAEDAAGAEARPSGSNEPLTTDRILQSFAAGDATTGNETGRQEAA